MRVYLDYAAATPMDPKVAEAMRPYFTENFFNPSATYESARQARSDLKSAAARISSLIGVKSSELIFTSGGTEANNLAIHGVMSKYANKKSLISAIEHESVTEPAKKWNFSLVPVDEKGVADPSKMADLIDDDVVLVSVMLANNEVGSIQPIKQISSMLEKVRRERISKGIKTPLYFHTDAAQAPLYLDIHPHRLGVDILSLNGGKIYGPKQAGALFVKAGLALEPLMLGGGQQRGMRSGTESPAAVVGLAKALELAQTSRADESKRLSALQEYFFGELAKKLPGAIINGPRKKRLPSNIHFTIPGNDSEVMINRLDEAGVIAAAGSACSAADEEPSHVLRAMGISDELARSSLRLTMGKSTNKTKLDYVLTTLAGVAS